VCFPSAFFRSAHSIHYYPVYLLSEIERWLVPLAEERKIIGQSEIFGRIDIGTDEFHLGWLSAMSQVSLPNAEAVDELVGFDPGLPSSNPALSILKRPVF